MNHSILSLQLFTRVASRGSFSAASRELGLSQSSASRIVATLEQEIGVALLTRTTRAVTLTEAGVEYLARIGPILAALEEADHAVRGNGTLRGLLRVATSSALAVREVIPRLAGFSDMHPSLRIEFLLKDQRQDLVSDGIDVALRVGDLGDSSGVACRIGTSHRLLAASPSYLKRAGTPQVPADLVHHTIITGPAGFGPFQKGGETFSVRAEGRFIISSLEGSNAAAVTGLGIVSTGHLACRAELMNGALVRVLPDWEMGTAPVSAILPGGRAAKPSARAFVEFMTSQLRDQ